MTHVPPPLSLDHERLLEMLAASSRPLLLIQDLDGVCMGLVRDPLTRRIEPRYVEAVRRLDGHVYVLTNGEHIGRRGVNRIVESALGGPQAVREQGAYLPGLGAGGVQWQDRHGQVSHPGVGEAELAFLAAVPRKAERFLGELLAGRPFLLETDDIGPLLAASVLDNAVSPTVNINSLHHHLRERPACYRQLQVELVRFMDELLAQADEAGLGDAFFVHYAPNLGRDPDGHERARFSEADDAGTTDFQFMLRGAVKEVGVLAILNRFYHRYTGAWPLGEGFNAREAPHEPDALLTLAGERFDPAHMPLIVGVGDTVTSHAREASREPDYLRGGSDRGFLTLVQQLGAAFDSDNRVVFVDSSGGEVRRPGVDASRLRDHAGDASIDPWPALRGITDPDDPLRLDVIFPAGHAQYVDFFCALAERVAGDAD